MATRGGSGFIAMLDCPGGRRIVTTMGGIGTDSARLYSGLTAARKPSSGMLLGAVAGQLAHFIMNAYNGCVFVGRLRLQLEDTFSKEGWARGIPKG